MKRGSLYWINLEPSNPPEFGKTRPGIIVSNTEHNLRLPTVVIVPLSTRTPEMWPLRIAFEMPERKKFHAVLPGIRQVNKSRLGEMVGTVSADLMEKLDEALKAYLGD